MSKKIKTIIAIGGTGGHVFPGCHLATHLRENNHDVSLVTDKRGYSYLSKFKYFKIFLLPSSRLSKKNIINLLYSFLFVIYSVLRCVIFLIFNRPSIIFGMGGYASFPICLAAAILRIRFVIYENNLIVGKANKLLLPFTNKIFVSNKELEGIPDRYNKKILEIGNIINKKIIYLQKKTFENEIEKLQILILGGSQAAEVFGEKLPAIFKKCSSKGVPIKIYQHCLPHQNDKIKTFYSNAKIEFETFNFSHNLEEYFSKINLAITRSGSSILAELTNANIPFISIPLPSSADNHQFKNGDFYKRKKFAFLVEENNLEEKLHDLILDIYKNFSILKEIKVNQSQHSDKNVYKNIDKFLKKIYEKN